MSYRVYDQTGGVSMMQNLSEYVDSQLRGLRFVGFMEAVRQATGMCVDIIDASHIEKDSKIDYEIRTTGV